MPLIQFLVVILVVGLLLALIKRVWPTIDPMIWNIILVAVGLVFIVWIMSMFGVTDTWIGRHP